MHELPLFKVCTHLTSSCCRNNLGDANLYAGKLQRVHANQLKCPSRKWQKPSLFRTGKITPTDPQMMRQQTLPAAHVSGTFSGGRTLLEASSRELNTCLNLTCSRVVSMQESYSTHRSTCKPCAVTNMLHKHELHHVSSNVIHAGACVQ